LPCAEVGGRPLERPVNPDPKREVLLDGFFFFWGGLEGGKGVGLLGFVGSPSCSAIPVLFVYDGG